MPPLLSAENQESVTRWLGSAWAFVTGDAPRGAPLRRRGPIGSPWVPLLLVSAAGVGAAAYLLGAGGRRRVRGLAEDAWRRLLGAEPAEPPPRDEAAPARAAGPVQLQLPAQAGY